MQPPEGNINTESTSESSNIEPTRETVESELNIGKTKEEPPTSGSNEQTAKTSNMCESTGENVKSEPDAGKTEGELPTSISNTQTAENSNIEPIGEIVKSGTDAGKIKEESPTIKLNELAAECSKREPPGENENTERITDSSKIEPPFENDNTNCVSESSKIEPPCENENTERITDSSKIEPPFENDNTNCVSESSKTEPPCENENTERITESSKIEPPFENANTNSVSESSKIEPPGENANIESESATRKLPTENGTSKSPVANAKSEPLAENTKPLPTPSPLKKEGTNQEGKKSNDADALEAVLYHVGDMGRYQKLLFLTMLPFGFFFAFLYFVQMFIAVAPTNYWCKIPELQHLDMEVRRNLSAPRAASGSWETCKTFDVNWSEVLQTMERPPEETPTIPCRHGWDFDFSDIPYETVTTERGWVCEYASYVPVAQAIFFAGSFVGGLFFGWVADTFGRVPALIGANLIGGVGGIATIYTTDVWDFVICRFLVGMSFDNAFMTLYILVLEYVGARHRTWVANMSIALFFGGGCLSLPWIALWLSDWRKLLWFTSMPMFIALFVPFVVPESARWLTSRGRVSQAVEVLRKFERVNGTKIPEDVMDEFIVSSNQTKQSKESLLVLFRSPLIRTSMILLLLVYMACSIIFDGLVRMSNAFGLDFFITFTLTSATEIPSIALLTLLLDRWGRRNLTTGPMILSGTLIIIALFIPKGIPQATLAIAARFCINMSYNAVIQWGTELLPTPVRASGSATLHMSGYVATVISPFIVFSEIAWSLLPLLILGIVAIMGSFMSILLPETKGLPMPQTMADSERIVREKSLCGKPQDTEDVECINDKEKSFIT